MSLMIVLSCQVIIHLFKKASIISLESHSTHTFVKPLTFANLKASRRAKASATEIVLSQILRETTTIGESLETLMKKLATALEPTREQSKLILSLGEYGGLHLII